MARWFPRERTGTALGIFGMGTFGSAITNFSSVLMVAVGWVAIARIWAAALAAVAVGFYLLTKDDPQAAARRQAPSLAQQLAPLRKLQVWRFAIYYFFVFGAFVALALMVAALLHRRIRHLRRCSGHARDRLLASGQRVPRCRRLAFRPVRRPHHHVPDLRRFDRRHLPAELSDNPLCRAGHQGSDRVHSGHEARSVRQADLHPRHVHELRHGGGLQAHPGLLLRTMSGRSAASSE